MKLITIILILCLPFALFSADIINTDKPLKGKWDLKPGKIWEITGAGDSPIARALIRVSEDGTCYIIDKTTKKNYIFDASGRFIKSIAPRGEGPGEMQSNLAIHLLEDKLAMIDLHKILFFTRKGELINSVKCNAFHNFPSFFVDGNNYIAITVTQLGKKRNERQIRLVNLKTETRKTLHTYRHGTIMDTDKEQKWGILEVPGITPWMILGYDYGNQKLYYGKNDKYRIHVSDLKGTVTGTFSVKRDRETVPGKSIKEWVKSTRPDVPYKQVAGKVPTELYYFHSIQVIDGLVYVYTQQWGNPIKWANRCKSQHIDIFSTEGKYLYRATFTPPEGESVFYPIPIQLEFIQRGHLYVNLEDEDGEVKLVKYKVSLPKANK